LRRSQLFGKTQRELPAEADTANHSLLLKAGMIRQLAAGVYTYLPLGWRVLNKVADIVRDEMNRAGGQEISMPVLQPIELWQKSGRDVAFGNNLFTLNDRRERRLALGPTHEEVVTDLVSHNVQSYRDLPQLLYQIQTKFRDEPRPRGGLIRVREFMMKDMYSFDADEAGLDISYNKMLQAYHNIYRRCGLPDILIEADSGAIGGKDSHEFMVATESGDDEIIYCEGCQYAANAEKATSVKVKPECAEPLPLEEVPTPGCCTIEEVSDFLEVPAEQTLKAVFYNADGQLVFVVIRGDIDVNEVKLKNRLRCTDLRLANDEEVKAAGLVAGAASPVGLKGIKVVADESINEGGNFVAGGNKPECHLKNVNYSRDFKADMVSDIALAKAGEGCPRCGGTLSARPGIEIGHIFKLGTFFSQKFGANYIDAEGNSQPIVMGCYGIGIGRLMAAIIEVSHDDKGIIWPMSVAPCQVCLCPLYRDDDRVVSTAESLYAELTKNGIEVLFDDRVESPGIKFNDADLLGIPLRVTVSPRSLDNGGLELKWRAEKESLVIPLENAAAIIGEMVSAAQDGA
jgi:prolyl-tRNA synthetase